MPITDRSSKISDFLHLIEQVKIKLTSWKVRQLSYIGRATLVKCVIKAIPIYPMMNFIVFVPKTYLKEIQRIQIGFVWGDT